LGNSSSSGRPTINSINLWRESASVFSVAIFTVAHDSDPVCDAEYFVQAMADKNDPNATVGQFPQDSKQSPHLARRQGGGRLVHDEDARFDMKGTGYFHELLLGYGQVGYEAFRLDIGAQPRQ